MIQKEAARDAEQLLEQMWGRNPGETIPIDPVRIARRLGIDVLRARLDSNVSAALVKEPGQDPTIVLNWMDSPNRQRFSCAHEIGHFVRRSDKPDEYEYVDFRDDLSSSGGDLEEIYANSFAASLLMPESDVRQLHRKGFNDLAMAVRFDVSREAMAYRLRNLDLKAR